MGDRGPPRGRGPARAYDSYRPQDRSRSPPRHERGPNDRDRGDPNTTFIPHPQSRQPNIGNPYRSEQQVSYHHQHAGTNQAPTNPRTTGQPARTDIAETWHNTISRLARLTLDEADVDVSSLATFSPQERKDIVSNVQTLGAHLLAKQYSLSHSPEDASEMRRKNHEYAMIGAIGNARCWEATGDFSKPVQDPSLSFSLKGSGTVKDRYFFTLQIDPDDRQQGFQVSASGMFRSSPDSDKASMLPRMFDRAAISYMSRGEGPPVS